MASKQRVLRAAMAFLRCTFRQRPPIRQTAAPMPPRVAEPAIRAQNVKTAAWHEKGRRDMDKKSPNLIEFFFVDLPDLTMVGKEFDINAEDRLKHTPFQLLEAEKTRFDRDFRGSERYMYCDTCFAWTGERNLRADTMKYMIGKVFKKKIDLPSSEYRYRSFGGCKAAEGIVKSDIVDRDRLCYDAHRLMAAKLNTDYREDYAFESPIWSMEMYTPDYFYDTAMRKHAVLAYFMPIKALLAS
jgi:hypothetical protein